MKLHAQFHSIRSQVSRRSSRPRLAGCALPLSSTSQTRPRLAPRGRDTWGARNPRKGPVMNPSASWRKDGTVTTGKLQLVRQSPQTSAHLRSAHARQAFDPRRLRLVGSCRQSRSTREDPSLRDGDTTMSQKNSRDPRWRSRRDSFLRPHPEQDPNGFRRGARRPCQQHTHLQQVAGCLHVDRGGSDGP